MKKTSKPSLKKLISKLNTKHEIKTSVGPLYVRNITYADLANVAGKNSMEASNVREIGLHTIKLITSDRMDTNINEPLSESIFLNLNYNDLCLIASAAVKLVNDEDVGDDLISALGKGVVQQWSEISEASKNISSKLKSGYGFLNSKSYESLYSFIIQMNESNERWKSKSLDFLSNSTLSPEYIEKLKESIRITGVAPGEIDSKVTPSFRTNFPVENSYTPDHTRALSELAVSIGDMQSSFTSVNNIILTEIIPQWTANQNEWRTNQELNKTNSDESLQRAADSLKWTKYAVFAGVVMSALVPIIQGFYSKSESEKADRVLAERYSDWQKQSEIQNGLLNKQILEIEGLRSELKAQAARVQSFDVVRKKKSKNKIKGS